MTRSDAITRPRSMLTEFDARTEFALFLRALHREGYDDHLAGHATSRQPDGTLLVNPFQLCWDEVRASDIVVMDATGTPIDSQRDISPAIALHLEVRRRRPDIGVLVHNHPRWSGIWASAKRVPRVFDQTSAQISAPLVLVEEYDGAVDDRDEAAQAAAAFGDAEWALLANHGVLLSGDDTAHAYLRAITLEWRARRAWEVESLGQPALPLDPEVARRFGDRFERAGAPLWWAAARRREHDRDPSVGS